jgi:hypothetical protein
MKTGDAMSAAREFRPLATLGLRSLPDRAEDGPGEDREQRSACAEVVRLLPHCHPRRLRIVSPDEVAAALEPKPSAPQSDD